MKQALILILGLALTCCSSSDESGLAENKLHSETLFALLDLIDTVVEKNPDYTRTIASLRSQSREERESRLRELSEKNAQDPDIQARIAGFLNTAAMQAYFKRFSNVTPDDYRRAFLALPFAAIDAPGDIAKPFFGMVEIKDDLRLWATALDEFIDLGRCRQAAQHWLPAGKYSTPQVYLVYDGNAGSYTAGDKAYYNLYSELVSDLLPGMSPRSIEVSEMEAVITHELQHVLAAEHYAAAKRPHDSWQQTRMDAVVRGLVSEGSACHCNPPAGFRKELWEDRQTIEALIAELNRTFLALSEQSIDETQFKSWFAASFHELPRRLLGEYLERRFPELEVDGLMHRYASERPDLLHALGWWMVSRISSAGAEPESVRQLVAEPYQLFSRYNATLGPADGRLMIDGRLITDE